MKKVYVQPTMESEKFIPNAYCVACSGKATYDAWCNYSGYIFNDKNQNGRIDQWEDYYIYTNTACYEHYRSDQKPEWNALAFRGDQVEEKWIGPFPTYVVKKGQEGKGVRGFRYNREHFSTEFKTDPHYVS